MFRLKGNVLKVRCVTYSELKRFICEFETNYQLFKNYFGLHQYKASDYIKEESLTRIPPETIMKVINYCESHGYNKKDILDNPMLFRLNPTTLDQYYSVMTEGGFHNIKLNNLAKFRTICRKSVYTLKENHLIDLETDVASSFIKYLAPCPEGFYVNSCDIDPWSAVHLKILKEYLKWRLNTTEDKVVKLITTHPTICRKSFKYLCENISLAEELGFTHEKMLKYGYILHAYPYNTREILEKYSEIAGVSIRRAMRMYPKLVTTPASNIQKIYNILKEHNISDIAIAKRMNVFHMSPETVEFRLKELERVDDLKVLLYNPNVLRLVVHHNRAKSRLAFLKQLQLKCATVTVLGNDDIKFDHHIRQGKDINTFTDTYAFLKGIFGKETNEFETILKKHPYYLQVPLTEMEQTYDYLIEEKFNNSSIFKVIYILLYPKDKIKNVFQQVTEYEKLSGKKLTQINKLNLILYFIEKDHHFNGEGIWKPTAENLQSI